MKQVRALAAALAIGTVMLGCGGAPPPKPATTPEPTPLHVSPLTDLTPAAALVWLLEVHPRVILGDGRLAAALAPVAPDARLQAFAREWGGVDLRAADTLVFASYPGALLSLVHQTVDPGRIEAAFTARVLTVEGRSANPRAGITRLWGNVGSGREQVAIFGGECVGLEQGRFGPLRIAELFAEEKLKRASPALKAPPLARVAELLGDAPIRAFAPGPFEGDLQRGAGGLLGASTAVGASIHVAEAKELESPRLAVRILLLGGWGGGSRAAADRLRAVFEVLAASGLGKLLGLSQLLAGPTVGDSSEALTVDFTVDAALLVTGLRAATAAEAREIMGLF